MVVLSASAHDNEAGIALLDQAAERCGMRLEKVLVDQGFEDAVIVHGAVNDTTVEVVRRSPADEGKSAPGTTRLRAVRPKSPLGTGTAADSTARLPRDDGTVPGKQYP
ncbi:hypothetical protein OG385_32875 [Streptomyces sp. NBC_01306]|nr:hypothetical protein [Streptomyces sp. NBC_01306]